jgi:hypothetical protein
MSDILDISEKYKEIERIYNNSMQILASVIDTNTMLLEAGRAAGKTEWFGKRMMNVAYDMPGELSFFGHKTYMALVSNIVPNLITFYNTPRGDNQRPLLRQGIDFVVGEKDLPSHFAKPRFPILNPNHSMVYSNGHHVRLVATDQQESVAGANGVHFFNEEMKHNSGEKLASRVFPALRGGMAQTRASHYYLGITGLSDSARVDLGEDNWFEKYEKQVDHKLIREIVTVSLQVNRLLYNIETLKNKKLVEKDLSKRVAMDKQIASNIRKLMKWKPILRHMRSSAVFYLRASSFVNKDFLGLSYFKTQIESLTMEEFLSAIGGIRVTRIVDMFFGGFDDKVHACDDDYTYKSIHDFNLKDTFRLTSEYLKYYNTKDPLVLGYDPGHFSSVVVAQEKPRQNELRILKEFFCWHPLQQDELAKQIFMFFGANRQNKKIILYHDRAGNKKKGDQERITTDARILKRELESYGFNVELKNEKQRTIFYYEHYKLLTMLLAEKMRHLPRIRIGSNECPNLISSIHLSPIKRTDGRIEMDKSSETTIPLQHQAALSTQISSAAMYLIYGLYGNRLPKEINRSAGMGHIENMVT